MVDDHALKAVQPHTDAYWSAATSLMPRHSNQDPLPESNADHHDSPSYKWTIDAHDIMLASWQLATLLFGPDDGSIERDDIECQMQEVLKTSFDCTMER